MSTKHLLPQSKLNFDTKLKSFNLIVRQSLQIIECVPFCPRMAHISGYHVLIHLNKIVKLNKSTVILLNQFRHDVQCSCFGYIQTHSISSDTYIINKPPTKLLENKSLYELWFSSKTNYGKFHVLEASFLYLWDYSSHKLDPRSVTCVFI